jgi:hypothetical protein
MKTNEKLRELKSLQLKVDTLRAKLGNSSPGEVTFLGHRDALGNDIVIVEADGFGGATTRIVEGNYPVDYVTRFERFFESEEEAEAAAEKIAFNGISPHGILGVPA